MASTDRILEAARGEFAQHGYAARLQDIAERAGLTHPTLLADQLAATGDDV